MQAAARDFKPFKVLRLANGRLQRSSNKGLWPECLMQAAARDFKPFKGFKAGNRQA